MARIQPQWRIIDQTLDGIRVEIVKHPAFTTSAGGPDASAVKFHEDWDKLGRYIIVLQRSLQSVKNSANLLWVQTLAAKRIPREHRYSVNQSLRARQSNLEHVHQKAQNLLDLLEQMAGNYGAPDPSSLDQLFENAEETLMALVSDPGHAPEPGIGVPTAATPAMPMHSLIAMIIYYLVYLRKRR